MAMTLSFLFCTAFSLASSPAIHETRHTNTKQTQAHGLRPVGLLASKVLCLTGRRPWAWERLNADVSVLIDGPPFDEHLAQLAARIERIAGKDEQVGRLARFQGAVCLVDSKEGGGPGGKRFQRNLARQAASYQIGNGKERKILGGKQVALARRLGKCEFQSCLVQQMSE